MHFEKKISIGDLVAVVVAISAILGVYWQARSTDISEENLQIKIDNISQIVEDLEEQQRKLLDERIERLSQGTDLYDSQSAMHAQLLDIGRFDRQLMMMYVRALILSQSTLHVAMSSVDVDESVSKLLSQASKTNASLASLLAFVEEWQKELSVLSEEYDRKSKHIQESRPVTSEIPERLEKLYEEYAEKVALIIGRYEERLKPIREEFVKSQNQLYNSLSDRFGEGRE